MRSPKRTARKFDRAVRKAEGQIQSGALNVKEDYVNPSDMTDAQYRAYLNTLKGSEYSNEMMNKTKMENAEGAMEFQKKGGVTKKTNSFFNPSLSKNKK
jgi:hypothetical protein